MYFYKFNIGDYASHTRYLSPMQDLAYRRLLDLYYLHEKPIPKENPAALIGMNDCLTDVEQVLNDYFIPVGETWVNKRADDEILEYRGKKKSTSTAGKKSGEVRKANKAALLEQTFNDCSTDVQLNKKQETLNKKQETLKETTKRVKRVTPDGVVQTVWDDFLQLRKERRAPVTDTVMRGLEKEAQKAGLSLNAALEHCCLSTWQTFKAEWYLNKSSAKQSAAYEAPWVKQNREWFESATGKVADKDIFEMETNVTRIAK